MTLPAEFQRWFLWSFAWMCFYTISHYRSTQRCAAIFSQDDPRRSLRSRSYGTTSKEK